MEDHVRSSLQPLYYVDGGVVDLQFTFREG